MFKRKVLNFDEVVRMCLRENGLETPLLQTRLVDAWEQVAGDLVARYTEEKFIRNQTLFVKISSPALRSDLLMMREILVDRLNKEVGTRVISDIRIY